MKITRIATESINDVIRQYRRTSCADTQRALAVALVQARTRIQELEAEYEGMNASRGERE